MNTIFQSITDFIYAETQIERSDIIIIPGSSRTELIKEAALLYHDGFAPYILITGGPNSKLSQTEAKYLKEIGLSLGVPETAIFIEECASNTYENAKNALISLKEKKLAYSKIILVTKPSHARRVLLTFSMVSEKTTFFIRPATGQSTIAKNNWFLTSEGRDVTFSEVKKIGMYFPVIIRDHTKNLPPINKVGDSNI
ncbi:uncharacterized SAM-binding protein YcdF (DUF218 family) [Alkalihalobacillus xiaoxiensis]|uniref:Uncharacterized SAM-binding protein YcdF (DUF218 family) n=1 Tax=Shouchella xiaoxiensis TaxID=766895 RepID=A0ABS2STV4_9BACI|nr:YdcF family protein [Shouchella xiaoxiensis]MBM7838904.1 uncharacterized SAM-binding protein YcdF (DUF218 family) [Shouchella xiaoxiensis]